MQVTLQCNTCSYFLIFVVKWWNVEGILMSLLTFCSVSFEWSTPYFFYQISMIMFLILLILCCEWFIFQAIIIVVTVAFVQVWLLHSLSSNTFLDLGDTISEHRKYYLRLYGLKAYTITSSNLCKTMQTAWDVILVCTNTL